MLKAVQGLQGVDEVATALHHTLFKVGNVVLGCGSNADHQMSSENKSDFYAPTLIYDDD